MGGSILAQVTQQIGNEVPDLDEPAEAGSVRRRGAEAAK